MNQPHHFGYRPLYLAGALRDSSDRRRRAVVCPADEREVAQIAWANKADAEEALVSAHQGFLHWSQVSLRERCAWMASLRQALADRSELLQNAVMHEHGKTWDQAAEDVQSLLDALEFYAAEIQRFRPELIIDKDDEYTHQLVQAPVGVVVAYLAWNFPLLNLGFKLAPALAAGCSIIIKPSSETPLSAYIVGEACAAIGFPSGVVSILAGSHEEVSHTLTTSTIPRLVTLIGSTSTGRSLIRTGASSVKRYSMELGGNAPALVFADADLDFAASLISTLKFANAGQICVTPNRVLVEQSIFDEFAQAMARKASEIRVGFGRESGASMGPMINRRERERVMGLIADAIKDGARLLSGGAVPPTHPQGSFLQPTVLANVSPTMRIFEEEIFGPVVSLIPFASDKQALDLANATSMGLSSFLFTQNHQRIQLFSRLLEFGEVMVNGCKWAIDLPHLGIKESGIGCDCSHLALHEYLVVRRITTRIVC